MKKVVFPILVIFNIIFLQAQDNHRLIILADMGNEPDEMQQMTHMITCSNELDIEGAWICSKYPNIHWIRSNYQTYAYGGPGGTDGNLLTNLGPHYWHPNEYSTEGQNDWLIENVMTDHGEIGKVYPERRFPNHLNGKVGFMEGGGTIPWMGLVNKGLFDIDQPSWGGWGGRFTVEKVPDFWSRHKDIMVDEQREAPFYTYREVSDHWVDPQDGKFITIIMCPYGAGVKLCTMTRNAVWIGV